MAYIVIKGDELYHHGIKGMKWGVRRYQNADGSLKAAGRKRYTEGGPKSFKGNLHRLAAKNYELNEKTYEKMGNKTLASMNRAAKENSLKKAEAADAEKAKRISEKQPLTDEERAARNAKIKKAAIAAGAVAATAALAYVGHKYVSKKMDAAEKAVIDVGKKNVDRAFNNWQTVNDNSTIAKSVGDKLYDNGRKDEAAKYWSSAAGSRAKARQLGDRYLNLNDSYQKAIGDRKTNARVALATAKRDRALRKLDKSGKSVSRDQLDAIIAQYEHDVMDAIKKAK